MISRVACALVLSGLAAHASTEEAARKVLASRCWACHSQNAMAGLRLDSRDAMRKGGKSGPAIVPGKPSESLLYQAVARLNPNVKPMPPGKALAPDEQKILQAWIQEGAPWTGGAGEVFWSFRPLQKPAGNIDSIIRTTLRDKNLTANPPANKRTLIRRLSFDMTGLPPSPDDPAFADTTADWIPQLVDRLLASPHFGEKWGRHWLDVARYGEDDYSGTQVMPYANAWRYREWVVGALNKDLPYDRFLKAQIAGDLLGDPSLLPATGLFGLGPWYYGISQPPQARADERHDRVDMISRGMLGISVACARCHDHKYDPITAKDYYALAGVFASSAYKEYPLVPEADAAKWNAAKKEVDEAEKALNKFLDEQAARIAEQQFAPRIADYMMATVEEPSAQLNPEVLKRWKDYLGKPEEFHPLLNRWFAGNRTRDEAVKFQKLLTEILAEKKAVDEENRRVIEEGNKLVAKPARTIVLPGGYRSDEDFNPGAEIAIKSIDRDRYVAWNRTFNDGTAPLKFNRELTPKLLDQAGRKEYEQLKSRFDELKKALPPQYPYLHGMAEFEPWDLNLNIRGNPESLGDVVPRRFPTALSDGKTIAFNEGSGRLQLANTVAHHPLAARVAVNRIWLALFGQGIVRTPSNFGRVGDRPAIPDLLEYLATRFVERQYSMKSLIREIVLSDAYQRSSVTNVANERADTDNRLLWRQNRRRLEAEPLRDAMLAVSGELDPTVGGESKPLDAKFTRRTIYAKLGRFQQDETLSLFDLPAAAVTCEQRVITNVPLQKLFFLNSEIVATRAEALAKGLADPGQAISTLYRKLFQREPSAKEREMGLEFLRNAPADQRFKQYSQVMLSTNEFAYVD